MNSIDVEKQLSRFRVLTAAGTAFLVVFVVSITALMLWQTYTLGQHAERLKVVAVETHDALCAFRQGLQVRYDDGVAFLKKRPNGIPGISAADIQRSLDNQKDTLQALSGLDCKS